MTAYETMFIIHPERQEEQREEAVNQVKSLIETSGGSVTEVDEWGMRQLAYEIEDLKEGYYVLLTFESDREIIQELERHFKLSDDYLRYLITKIEQK